MKRLIHNAVLCLFCCLCCISFAIAQQQQCGKTTLTAVRGTITDGSGDDDYGSDLDCFWLIAPKDAKQIRLTFTSFVTEEDYDFITIYDGADTTASVIGSYSGSTLPPSIASSGGALLIRFTSDSYVEDDGWSAVYYSSTSRVLINLSAADLNFEPITFGLTAVQSFSISGTNLTEEFEIIAPTGFKVSKSENTGFTDTLRLLPTGASTKIFVQFNPPEPTEYYDRIVIYNGVGVANVNVYGFSPPAIYWEPSNGPFNGRITTMSVGAGNRVYAGTYGGMYRTTSSGDVWQQGNTGLNSSRTRTVYASLATNTGLFIGTRLGMYRSLDKGITWKAINKGLEDTTEVYCLAGFNDTLFAGTDYGVYRSFNNGESWESLKSVNDELDDDEYPTTLFVYKSKEEKVDTRINVEYTVVLGTDYGYIYRTTDFGTTWKNQTPDVGDYISSFAQSATHIFAATYGAGILRADKKDFDWKEIAGNYGVQIGLLYVNSLATASGRGVDMIYAATDDGIWRSATNGDTWEKSNRGLTEPYANVLVTNGLEVYAGTDAGVFRSLDLGGRWAPVNLGLTGSVVVALHDHRGVMLSGTAGSGVFRTVDNGTSWTLSNAGLRARFIAGFASKGKDLFAISYDTYNPDNNATLPGIWRSPDNGASWTAALIDSVQLNDKGEIVRENGIPVTQSPTNFYSLTITQRGIFAGGANGAILHSTNNGISWRQAGASVKFIDYTVTALTGGANNRLFAGTDGNGLYYTDDDGKTWIDIIWYDDNGDVIYPAITSIITKDKNIFAASDWGIWWSGNNGKTWEYLENFPDSVYASTLYTVGGVLYVGSYGDGVWRSINEGTTWEKVSDGIVKDADVFSLAASGTTDLYVGITGSVIYRSSLQLPKETPRIFLNVPDNLTAAPGETVDVPIILQSLQPRPATLPVVTGNLRFNASMLDPVDSELRKEAVVNGERVIPFQFKLPDTPGKQIKVFRFRALLGNSVATPLSLTNLSAEGIITLAPQPGLFTLNNLSSSGGATRLFLSDAAPTLAPSAPNPVFSNAIANVAYEITEPGQVFVSIVNVYGQQIKTLISQAHLPGGYEVPVTTSDLAPGVYFLVLQTPRHRVTQQMQVIR